MRTVSWRTLQGVGFVVALGAISACAGEKEAAADSTMTANTTADSAAMMPASGKWTASLMAMNGTNVAGSVSVMPGTLGGTTAVEVSITGAPANGVHPWHIHVGTCASGGDIAGPAADYQPLNADANGTATNTATINMPTPTSGEFHVNVHMSPADMATIVACGDLALGGM